MGSVGFPGFLLRFGAEDFLSFGCFFCFDFDLERLGMVHWLFGTACVCVINLFAMYWTASYKLFEVHEFQLCHFMVHYDRLCFC